MAFEPTEEEFHRPAFLVNISYCLGVGLAVRSDEVKNLSRQSVPINDVAKLDLGFPGGQRRGDIGTVIKNSVFVLFPSENLLLQSAIAGAVLQTRDKIRTYAYDLFPEVKVVVGAIKNVHLSRQ